MKFPIVSKLHDDRNVLLELTRKNVKSQYRGSPIGLIWTVLNPLLNTLVMYFVFTQFFPRDNYFILYLLCGNILFGAIRNSTTQALESSVRNRGLLLRTKINLYVFPVSVCLSSIVNFFFSLIALLPFMLVIVIKFGINIFTHRIFYIFLMVPAFLLFEIGMGLILDVLYVFFRDIKHIYGVFLTLWMYVTPIFYKIDSLKGALVTVINLNPMYHFIQYFRDCVYGGAIGKYEPSWTTLLILYGIGALFLVLGIIIFKSLKRKIIVRI